MNHLENTKLALKYWLTIPLKNVAYRLSYWKNNPGPHTCGTIACFGGWVTAMPEFVAMGVTAKEGEGGAPKTDGAYSSVSVADVLFGEVKVSKDNSYSGTLFAMKEDCIYDKDQEHLNDHELVTHRLKEHIKYLRRQK